ncbi:unnamed protein product [Schistocephalus solidus]|uniref:Uncharacterized protein n=1 Tax=Schistocephalus solidus TaxID=70667 RepID=A0A3P7DF45_SCHSO|nr:unnamed protein product [Schistocephalus solidus]
MPSQLQYSAEAAEMEVIQLPGLTRIDSPGLRSAQECSQDDGLGVQDAELYVSSCWQMRSGQRRASD